MCVLLALLRVQVFEDPHNHFHLYRKRESENQILIQFNHDL
jgi:hypothetical protein